jgi:hypothetical protein
MGSSICFYCSHSDNENLQSFAMSLGLHLISTNINDEVSLDPSVRPLCYLSIVPKPELHPYGNPPIRVTEALDPMIFFMRSYFKENYLVLGQIQWQTDVNSLAIQTKPYYQKLTRWIRKEWEKDGSFYIGNEAKDLITKGAEMVNFFPSS